MTTTTSTLAQQKVIQEIVPNSNKQQYTTPIRVQNPVKNHQQQKIETPSAWTTHEETQGTNILLMFFENFCFCHLFSDTIIDSAGNSTSLCSIIVDRHAK